ncbi:MAG TPA: SDR family oxidoreductase [Solirubrobacteraceae bacterium]|nr:SDR family oxidoreductase [Solirubrobacteraceae bacterium]
MTRNVFITGSGGGLGVAVVERFLTAGWNVTAPRRAEVDLNDPDAVRQAVEAAAPLHAVVNLAGGFAAGQPVGETPVEDFEAVLALNLRTTYVVCHAAIPHLAGDGAIVCTSSATAHQPFAGSAGYAASKAGVTALARAIAKEGVRCNVISPSLIDTPANRESMPESSWDRFVSPERIADVVLWLASPESGALNGAELPV